jgi:predicted hydrolase (HD superfamily)
VLSRFELFVILRNQLGDRGRVRRSLAVEAAMEGFAGRAEGEATLWGLAGLCADIDAELCAHNPERRGHAAEELLLTEGAPAEAAAAVRERLSGDPAEISRLGAALCAAEALVDEIYAALEAGDELDALEPLMVSRRLIRAAERRADPRAQRAIACLARAGLSIDDAAELTLAAMKRVREDLRL